VWLTVNGNAMSCHISYRHHVIKVCFQLDRYACALRRVALSHMSVVGHLAMWFTWFTSCCLTRYYIYIYFV